MKVDFDKTEVSRKRVGYIFHMEGRPEDIGIAYHYGSKDITFYYDGAINVQPRFYEDLGHNLIKDIYEGDTVSITF